MEYSTMRGVHSHEAPEAEEALQLHLPPRIVRSHTDDDDNHSVFDFDPIMMDKKGKMKKGTKSGNKRGSKHATKLKSASSEPPTVSKYGSHPYPSSISIQMDNNNNNASSPITATVKKSSKQQANNKASYSDNEFRSPSTSPGARNQHHHDDNNHDSSYNNTEEKRQPSSPGTNNNPFQSDLTRHYQAGQTHYRSNRLSSAVSSYSQAISCGIEDLQHRKEMVARITSSNKNAAAQDELLLTLGKSLASTHTSLGQTLELAGKYTEAKCEYQNAMGLLSTTCHLPKNDEWTKTLKRNVKRMERAMSVTEERKRGLLAMENAVKRLNKAKENGSQKEAVEEARTVYQSCIKKLLRIERDSLGESSYAYAKLQLKLAKSKCEGGDIDGGLRDGTKAVTTIKNCNLLGGEGGEHTLVGAACLFVANIYEKRVSMMLDKTKLSRSLLANDENDSEDVVNIGPECKSYMDKALELYANALGPLKFKYDHLESEEKTTMVQPDVAETLHKIAKLYGKKGSHSSAVDAYHRALEAYGVTSVSVNKDRSDISKKGLSSLYSDLHPDAAQVWYDLSTLHLKAQEYSDAIYASEKCVECSRTVLKSSSSYGEGVGAQAVLPILANQVLGDAHVGLGRYEDATRSYQDGYYQYKKTSSTTKKLGGFGSLDEARLLRKLGNALYHQAKYEDSKAHFMDALRVLRSSHDGGESGSPDFSSLLCDIGMTHIKCGEYTEAMNVLRLSLKMYADNGISDHSTEVERARMFFKEAQRGGQLESSKLVANSPPSSHHLVTTGSPATNMSSPQHSAAMMATPRSNATSLTFPSTANYSRSSNGSGHTSKMSGHGQLQTLLEELAEDSPHDKGKSVLSPEPSPLHSHHSGGHKSTSTSSSRSNTLQKSLASHLEHSKLEKSHLEESHGYEVQRLKTQLENAQQMAEQYQLHIKEVEADRDQVKKEKVFAAAAHRKEIEAVTQRNIDTAVLEAELETSRKEVEVSESSYQELVKAIDDEKERLNDVNESKVRDLLNEVKQLKDELNSSSVVDNNCLTEALDAKKTEVVKLREQALKTTQEMSSLKSTNLTLQSEKDAAMREITALKSRNEQLHADMQRLTTEVATARFDAAANMPNANNLMEVKKLQFELQQERSRRMILESSLQQEYERESSTEAPPQAAAPALHPQQQPSFAFPMPYGYPPMPMPMQTQMTTPSPANNRANHAKIKTLEIDLATERANKGMLESVINEMRGTHEQEKESMQKQYSSLVLSNEEEVSELMAEVGAKTAELDRISHELVTFQSDHETLARQLDDTTSELSDVKSQLLQMSCELSSTMEEKLALSNTVSSLERAKEEITVKLSQVMGDLARTKSELKAEKESLCRKEAESDYLAEENGRLKKEYNEAITLFESEMDKNKMEKEEIESTLGNEINRLQSEVHRVQTELSGELDTAKGHLKNVLKELEGAHRDNGALETEVKHTKLTLDNVHRDIAKKKEQINQKQQEIEEVTANYEQLEADLSELEGVISAEKQTRNEIEQYLQDTTDKLVEAKDTIEDLTEAINCGKEDIDALEIEKADLKTRLGDMELAKKKLDRVLRSIPQKLKDALPADLKSAAGTSILDGFPDNEASEPTSESVVSCIAELIKQIDEHVSRLNAVIKSRDESLEKAQWNLSNAAHDLDKLETKHSTLRQELKEMGDLQGDYDELLDQYEAIVEEKKTMQEKTKESLRKTQEERDIFESRLKEAVDDLEELESERDDIRAELDRVQQEFALKQTTVDNEFKERESTLKGELDKAQDDYAKKAIIFNDRICALQKDNELIEKQAEKEALEYEAALTEKDEKLRKLGNDILTMRAELDEMNNNNASVIETDTQLIDEYEKQALEYDAALKEKDTALSERDNRLENLEAELMTTRTELDEVRMNLASPQSENSNADLSSLADEEDRCGIYPDLLPSDEFGSDIVPDTISFQGSASIQMTSMNPFDDESKDSVIQESERTKNPFDECDAIQDSRRVTKNPFDSPGEDGCNNHAAPSLNALAHQQEVEQLKARVKELESANEKLMKDIVLSQEQANEAGSNTIEMEREMETLKEEVEDLTQYVQALEESNGAQTTQLDEAREEVTIAGRTHDNDTEAITALQNALDEKAAHHLEKIKEFKDQIDDLTKQNQSLKEELCTVQVQSSDNDDAVAAEVSSLQEQIDGFKDQIDDLTKQNDSLNEELWPVQVEPTGKDDVVAGEASNLKEQIDSLEMQNKQLSEQLAVATDKINLRSGLVAEVASLKNQVRLLEDNKTESSTKLAQSEAKAIAATRARQSDQETINSLQYSIDSRKQTLSDQGTQRQADLDSWKARASQAEQKHETDQATIASLQRALSEKDSNLQDTWKSQVVELQQTNAVINRELSELSAQTSTVEDHTECNSKISSLQTDLENALNNCEEKQLELVTVNAEFVNTMNSLNEYVQENKKLKADIESFSSVENDICSSENRNFEKEMNAAHSRFVSMEKALEGRVSYLQHEKDKLVADYTAEMVNKEEAHIQTKIELSAWKLEMQNALNDIESLKKERNELKDQVEAYVKSLEAMCMAKAELEENMHTLGLNR